MTSVEQWLEILEKRVGELERRVLPRPVTIAIEPPEVRVFRQLEEATLHIQDLVSLLQRIGGYLNAEDQETLRAAAEFAARR